MLDNYKIHSTVLIAILIVICSKCFAQELRSGDIIFRGALQQNLSQAIDKVTATEENAIGFSHMGVIFIENDSVIVYHSSPEKGVHRSKLNDFLYPDSDQKRISVVYRFTNLTRSDIKEIRKKAIKPLGHPYNFTYILEDEGYYCSEYVYELFEDISIFSLEPMTFKNPGETETNPTWSEYYKNLGTEVPEGKLGCNPNGMSRIPQLSKVKEFRR